MNPENLSTSNLLVGVVGSNCVVIAAEKYHSSQNSICTLDGKVTVGWSGLSTNVWAIIDKAKMYTNSVYGQNSGANRVVEFLIDPDIRVLNNLPTLPYNESFMVASCDKNEKYLYVTDQYGTISHVLASVIGRQSIQLTKFLSENYEFADIGILGAIDFALRTLCIVCEPDARFIEVTVTAHDRPFEVVDKKIVDEFLSRIKSNLETE